MVKKSTRKIFGSENFQENEKIKKLFLQTHVPQTRASKPYQLGSNKRAIPTTYFQVGKMLIRHPKEIMKMERHFGGLQRWLQK